MADELTELEPTIDLPVLEGIELSLYQRILDFLASPDGVNEDSPFVYDEDGVAWWVSEEEIGIWCPPHRRTDPKDDEQT